MTQTKVRPMVEGGLLAAIAIIFAMISVYLPVIGSFVTLIWPVPIVLLGVRHGLKWSIMSTLVSGVLIAMLLEPLQAMTVIVGSGLIGIVLGYAFRRKFSPMKTMFWGSVTSILSKVILFGVALVVTGINPLDIQSDIIAKSMEQGVEVYRNFGMPEQELAIMKERMQSIVELVKVILPAGFILAAILETLFNFSIAKLVLKKLGHPIADLPPFKEWMLPNYITYLFVLALAMIYWGQSHDLIMLYQVGMNVQTLTTTLLLVQGLSIFYYFVGKYNLSRAVMGIILFMILTNGLLSQIAIFAGAVDTIIDYRGVRASNQD